MRKDVTARDTMQAQNGSSPYSAGESLKSLDWIRRELAAIIKHRSQNAAWWDTRVAMDESTLNPAAVREDLLRKEVQRVLQTRRHDMERRFKDMVLKYETRVKSISVGSGGSHGVE